MTAARNKDKARIAALVGVVLVAGAWALWPVHGMRDELERALRAGEPASTSGAASVVPEPLDLAAFDAPAFLLAAAPPPPPHAAEPAAEPRPLPALRIELVAIALGNGRLDGQEKEKGEGEDGEGGVAVCYDPEADQLIRLRVGDTRAGRTVESIDESGVTLTMNGRRQTLTLPGVMAALGVAERRMIGESEKGTGGAQGGEGGRR